jgi:hypothetical protein
MAGLLVMLVLLLSNLSQVVYVSEAQTTTVTTTSTITSTVTSYTTVTSSTVTRTVTGTRTTYTTSTTTVDVTNTHTSTQTVATTITRTTTTTITEQQTQDTIRPTVRVIAPNGGERLSPGSVFRIRWEASDNVGVTSVYIRLYQEGVMRVIIADNLPNTGYYDWTVPNRPGSNYKIVVIARDAAGNFGEDESDGTFEIVGAAVTAILQIGIRHTYIGDLRIWVGVEGGREVLIWNREGGSAQNLFREWDLLQLGFTTNDLPPSESRRWYLRIRDEANRDEGRLEYFRIIYQGQTYESQDHPEIRDYQEVRAWISPTTPQPFDFRLTVTPTVQMIRPGESAIYNIIIEHLSGQPQSVELSISGLPSGAVGLFNPDRGVPTFTSVLTVNTAIYTTSGGELTIRASGGGVVKEVTVSLIILPVPPMPRFVRMERIAVTCDKRTLYFELHWSFLLRPVGPSDVDRTWPEFTNARMRVTPPEGTYINYFQVAGGELGSGPLSGIGLKILIWAGTQLIKTIAPGWGGLLSILASIVSELLKAFEEINNRNLRVTSIEATLDVAHFFTELIFVVQVNSDTPRESWPIMIDASADRMAGPNIVAETMRQIETITISGSVQCS